MSPANSASTSTQSARRFHARRRMEGLIYADLGPDNGGILIDLAEGGLGFQSVVPMSMDQAVLLKFKVPGEADTIEVYAEVAWLNESAKGGGLRFVELSETARAQIRGWTGELEMPEPDALTAGNRPEMHIAEESAAQESSDDATEPTAAREAANIEDAPAEISASFSGAINTQPPSPQTPPSAPNDAPADQIPAASGVATAITPVPEFAVEMATEGDASEPVAAYFDSPLPVEALSAANASEIGTAKSAVPSEQERNADHAGHAAAPENSAVGTSKIAEATPHFEKAVPPQSSSESAWRPPAPAGSQASAKPAGIPRASDVAPGIAQPSTTTKPARAQSSDFRNLPPALKRQRKASSAKSESSLPSGYRQDSITRGSFGRQSPKPASAGTEWENLDSEEDEATLQPTLVAQALKIGIGGGAGAGLVLVLVFAVPFLRTLVQTTANARSAGLNPADAPAFQVEVADLNNRRWILRSGGDAGSPFSDTPVRRETQPGASNAARKESTKSSRADDSDSSTQTVTTPEPKLAKPRELLLPRPLAKPADASAAQLVAPSIFDGITPPIGSLTDRLPGSGPDMPGIVSPAGPVSNRAATLQSAVLLQRVAPIYPPVALQAKVQGEVSVNATIGKDGVPRDLKAIKGDERLVAAAYAAIRQWRYRPATLGGVPIETQAVVTVSFELK